MSSLLFCFLALMKALREYRTLKRKGIDYESEVKPPKLDMTARRRMLISNFRDLNGSDLQ